MAKPLRNDFFEILNDYFKGYFGNGVECLQCYECNGKSENCLNGLQTCPVNKIRCVVRVKLIRITSNYSKF